MRLLACSVPMHIHAHEVCLCTYILHMEYVCLCTYMHTKCAYAHTYYTWSTCAYMHTYPCVHMECAIAHTYAHGVCHCTYICTWSVPVAMCTRALLDCSFRCWPTNLSNLSNSCQQFCLMHTRNLWAHLTHLNRVQHVFTFPKLCLCVR